MLLVARLAQRGIPGARSILLSETRAALRAPPPPLSQDAPDEPGLRMQRGWCDWATPNACKGQVLEAWIRAVGADALLELTQQAVDTGQAHWAAAVAALRTCVFAQEGFGGCVGRKGDCVSRALWRVEWRGLLHARE